MLQPFPALLPIASPPSFHLAIGKESNSLEEVEAGLVHSAENVYTVYPDPRRDEWQTKILPALRKIPLPLLAEMSGISRRALIDIRAARRATPQKSRNCLWQSSGNLA
jgi:hypothetical protein